MYIYQIGCITKYFNDNKIEKAIDWRKYLSDWAEDNNVKVFNPILTYLKEVNHSYNPRLCVLQNDYYINACDIAVANMDDIDSSPGSIYELISFYKQGKPVIAFGGNLKHWSPHLNICISHWCNTLDEVIDLLCNMFNQNNLK